MEWIRKSGHRFPGIGGGDAHLPVRALEERVKRGRGIRRLGSRDADDSRTLEMLFGSAEHRLVDSERVGNIAGIAQSVRVAKDRIGIFGFGERDRGFVADPGERASTGRGNICVGRFHGIGAGRDGFDSPAVTECR